ncbi:ankyrin repeat-containing domain protein [Aspergillus alliaceus]|uniref:Ankyrin repeat-containing domain protein n=1 Tax=Petromyces alliaceus TaxID=209559 RepID=A0A5N7CBX1_PETAA|nr:ankyrin repeat-containing domain protein [Aspergillus alliaceus]
MPDLLTLCQAASVGDTGAIQMLLDNGADVNSMDDQPGVAYTALHHASAQGHGIAVRLLLHRSADFDKFGSDGMTALHLAAQNGHEESVRVLLEHGIDVNQRAQFDHLTPLHLAAEAGNLPVVHALLHHGADIAAVDATGNSALHFSAKKGHIDVTAALIAHGADAHAQNELQESPLHGAACSGNERTVRVLLEHGVDPWTGHVFGFTPLECAIRQGHEHVVRELLSQEHFPMPRPDGESALVAAAGCCQDIFVKLLLDMGFDANSTNEFVQPHRIPTMPGQFVTISELERNLDLHSELRGPWSALHAAVHCGSQAITRVLLDNSANPDCIDAYGWTPLHSAASRKLDLVPLLLEYGADANIRDKQGCIPLHWAVAGSVVRVHGGGWSSQGRNLKIQEEAVAHLLQCPSDINTRNNDGQTALHWAVRYGEKTIACQLIEQHADLRITDVYGRTALDWAIECGREDMVDMLT